MRIKPTIEALSKVKSRKLKPRVDPLMAFVREHNRSLLVRLDHAKLAHQVAKYLKKDKPIKPIEPIEPIIRNLADLSRYQEVNASPSLQGVDSAGYNLSPGYRGPPFHSPGYQVPPSSRGSGQSLTSSVRLARRAPVPRSEARFSGLLKGPRV
jgi:hypothetical protein